MIKVVARHQSGHWSEVDTPSFRENTMKLRKPDHQGASVPTLISRTEVADQSTNRTFHKVDKQTDLDDDWRWFHPHFPGTNRFVDCSLEWNVEYWKLLDHGIRVLTDFRVTTADNHVELLPSNMPWVILESKLQKNWLLLFSVAHNNLDNTPRRAAAWVEEGHTFKGFQKRQAAHHKGIHRLHQADMNKNIRRQQERLQVQNGMLMSTGLKYAWNIDKLPKKGTTKWGAIIDYSCSNMETRGTTKIGGNTGFSDHNWIETTWHA